MLIPTIARRSAAPSRRGDWLLALARVGSAAVFISFGLGKFIDHASEASSFAAYGLPAPGTFAYLIGVLEFVGGVMLALGLLTRLSALALAGDMVGAIIVSGILRGEDISLTLAPALLVVMLVLVWRGPATGSLAGLRRRR